MRHLTIALSLILAACAFGTVRYGSGNLDGLKSLEPGKATKTDVLTVSGPPLTRARGVDGAEVWTYSWAEAKSTGFVLPFYYSADTTSDATVAVLFFQGEILERIDWYPHPRKQ